MNRIILFCSFVICLFSTNSLPLTAKPSIDDGNVKKFEEIFSSLQEQQNRNENAIRLLSNKINDNERKINALNGENVKNRIIIDSLQKVCRQLENVQIIDRKEIKGKIDITDLNIRESQNMIDTRTLWGGIIIFVIAFLLIAIAYIFYKRIQKGTSTIDDVRKAQEALKAAQSKMQEDSVKLDNQMLTLIQQQIAVIPSQSDNNKIDHSLALKVADEIVRIELNLSRMDSSVKGYKQLSKAVERIKNNFLANGYEIVDMLGKQYIPGIKAAVTFVSDENLEEGKQIITKIIKPQINYHQQMIQAAEIEVSQSE